MTSADEGTVQRLLEKGLATPEQIEEVQRIQAQMQAMGLRPRSVAEILVEKGYLVAEDLESLQHEAHETDGRDRIGGFEILELIGRGALGSVYKARQVSLDRVVALKVLDPELAKDAAYAERFLREARAVARLSHTNLVSGIDVGEDAGLRYVAMELADGVTLGRLLRRGGALDEERALLIAIQLARALEYAHKNRLVHGDVRPENVIITGDGVAKLTDLGVARHEARVTEEGQELGVEPDYLSPEQARGKSDIGPAADLYALGCVMFHLLTGRVPFPAPTREAVVARHLTEPAPRVRQLAPEVTEDSEQIVTRLLEKAPEARYASASQVLQAIDQALPRVRAARQRATPPPIPREGAPPATGAPVVRRRRRR